MLKPCAAQVVDCDCPRCEKQAVSHPAEPADPIFFLNAAQQLVRSGQCEDDAIIAALDRAKNALVEVDQQLQQKLDEALAEPSGVELDKLEHMWTFDQMPSAIMYAPRDVAQKVRDAACLFIASRRARLCRKKERVTLAECPPGLFLFRGIWGFKSEYDDDAYVLESGEFFWGGATTKADRAKLLVKPMGNAGLRAEIGNTDAK